MSRVFSHRVTHVTRVLLHDEFSHFVESVITVRKELVDDSGIRHIVEVRPVGVVVGAVLVALNRGAESFGVIPELVRLKPVRRNPGAVAFLHVKLHEVSSFLGVRVCVLVEHLDGQAAMHHLDDCVGIAVVVDWTAVVSWPDL